MLHSRSIFGPKVGINDEGPVTESAHCCILGPYYFAKFYNNNNNTKIYISIKILLSPVRLLRAMNATHVKITMPHP